MDKKKLSFNILVLLVLCKTLCFCQENINGTDSDHVRLRTTYTSFYYQMSNSGKWMQVDSSCVHCLIIESSLPKGDRYVSPDGQSFGAAVFWSRIINNTSTQIDISIRFPIEGFKVYKAEEAYLKLFLPPGKMTVDKESMYNYGATELRSFLDRGITKISKMDMILNPEDRHMFYIGGLAYKPGDGRIRTALKLEGDQLYYEVDVLDKINPTLIPCGRIEIKK